MRRARFEIFRDGWGQWRWRLRASNGRIVADSAEGYAKRSQCRRAAIALAGLRLSAASLRDGERARRMLADLVVL